MAEETPDKKSGRLRVQVTEADIAKAHVNDSLRCVVAQALARTLPDATRIDVDAQAIRFTSKGERHVYLTPYSVIGYVIAFDAGDEIQPFTFQLDTRQRIPTPRKKRTEAGAAIENAGHKVRRTRAKRAKVAEKVGENLFTPAALEQVDTELVEAEAKLEGVRAAYVGQQQEVYEGEGRKKPIPRAFRRSTREYGHRIMRINQEPNVPDPDGAPF